MTQLCNAEQNPPATSFFLPRQFQPSATSSERGAKGVLFLKCYQASALLFPTNNRSVRGPACSDASLHRRCEALQTSQGTLRDLGYDVRRAPTGQDLTLATELCRQVCISRSKISSTRPVTFSKSYCWVLGRSGKEQARVLSVINQKNIPRLPCRPPSKATPPKHINACCHR